MCAWRRSAVWMAAVCALLCCALRVRAEAVAPQVRYHFGDDVRWSDAGFDDSAWPIADGGRWPMPAAASDGFMWIRLRVPVPAGASERLTISVSGPVGGMARERIASAALYVNGKQIGIQGALPPKAAPVLYGQTTVFDVPTDAVHGGTEAVVAYRIWYPPYMSRAGMSGSVTFAMGDGMLLRLREQAGQLADEIASGPDLALNGLILLLGLCLFLLWRRTGERELLIFGVILVSTTLFSFNILLYLQGISTHSWSVYTLVYFVLGASSMGFSIELIWMVHRIRRMAVKRLYQAAVVLYYGSFLIARLSYDPTDLARGALWMLVPSLLLYNAIQVGVNLWAIVVRKQNRLFAFAFIATSVTAELAGFGVLTGSMLGPFRVSYFGLAFFLCDVAIFLMLGQRAWRAWRARDELQAELDTAREVQQRMVPPAEPVPGFEIASVYVPARQVGGDFFRVLPESNGGALIVVGDVSGKGLQAAMTVSAIIGALRTMPELGPGRILSALNRGLAGQMGSGFVTCCAVRINGRGAATMANAGHLSPYLNGAEVATPAGLPLGITTMAEYEEMEFQLAEDAPLTFLSDGIVEARNEAGELFGFERTVGLSQQSPDAIAQAAIAFGQEDDITVLTVKRVGEGAA